MAVVDPDLPTVFTRAEARAAGLTSSQVHRRVMTGHWERLRRGQFMPESQAVGADLRWRAEVLATLRAHRRDLVLSHTSAARAWGLPHPLGGWGPLTFTARQPPVRNSPALKIGVAPVLDADVVPMGLVAVTSAARTVVDCARTLPPRDALAIADAAVHSSLCSPAELAAACARMRGWRGAPQARRILDLVDGRRETTLESWSAWSFHDQNVPPALWQATLSDDGGAFLGRVDGWWAEGVAGEADGRVKYGLAALEHGGVSAAGLAAALDDERRREDRLRRAGVLVVRWTAGDVLDPGRSRRWQPICEPPSSRAGDSRARSSSSERPDDWTSSVRLPDGPFVHLFVPRARSTSRDGVRPRTTARTPQAPRARR
jgi:hypothetical protein